MPGGAGGIDGFVVHGFAAVADAFRRNFRDQEELGAAFAAVRDGEVVVDLFGGIADRIHGRPWLNDTVAPIFSGAKGVVATCMLLLSQRGCLDLDAAVCRYWPEFAARGKADIRVRDCLTHTARLPGIERAVTLEEVRDSRYMAGLVAEQAPCRDPRATFLYHPFTFGWICDELVRRIDGRSVGRLFADEVAHPLGLDIWIGLPERIEPRVARMELHHSWREVSAVEPDQGPDDRLRWCISNNPPLFDRARFPWNSRAFHAAEIPAAGAIASARSMAHLYGSLDRVLSAETLRVATQSLVKGTSSLTGERMHFGLGFQLQVGDRFGPVAQAFGHGGAGGSIHGAWPMARVGFSYVMNVMRDDVAADRRAPALLRSLHAAVATATAR